MATKRSKKEMELDIQRIKEAAMTAKSITELATITGLSRYQVQKTLEGHPIIEKRVKAKLEKNKASNIENLNTKNEVVISSKTVKQETDTSATNTGNFVKRYVIDASVSGTENILEKLKNIIASNHKIVITSITIYELEKLQNGIDPIAKIDARKILAMAAEDFEHFETVLIDRSVGIPDDCIINYCKEHNENLVLLTADKTMALKARMYSIEVEYLKHVAKPHDEHSCKKLDVPTPKNEIKNHPVTKPFVKSPAPLLPKKESIVSKHNVTSLPCIQHFGAPATKTRVNMNILPMAKMINNKLRIEQFHTSTTSVRVLSYGQEYNVGSYDLRVGDVVLVAVKIGTAIDFKAYRVTSLSEDNNCKIIFSKTIYNPKRINLSDHNYKAFIAMFKVRHQL